MKDITTVLPDAHYEVKSFATDTARNNVVAYGVFMEPTLVKEVPVLPDGSASQHGLRLCDAIRGRQDRQHDQNLERGPGTEGTRLGVSRYSYNARTPSRAGSEDPFVANLSIGDETSTSVNYRRPTLAVSSRWRS